MRITRRTTLSGITEIFSLPVRVYYEDTDAGGIVYHASYLRFAERSRTEWLRQHGLDQSHLWEAYDTGFVVASCQIDYHAPGRLDDALHVTCVVSSRGRSSFVMHQQVLKREVALATLRVTLVCVNRELRPCRIPEALEALILNPVR